MKGEASLKRLIWDKLTEVYGESTEVGRDSCEIHRAARLKIDPLLGDLGENLIMDAIAVVDRQILRKSDISSIMNQNRGLLPDTAYDMPYAKADGSKTVFRYATVEDMSAEIKRSEDNLISVQLAHQSRIDNYAPVMEYMGTTGCSVPEAYSALGLEVHPSLPLSD